MAAATPHVPPPTAGATSKKEDFDFPRFNECGGPGYKHGATVSEETGSHITQTWSAAFCHRPPRYHVRGPAQYWRKEWTLVQKTRDPLDMPQYDESTWPKLFATVNNRTLRLYKTASNGKPECTYRHVFPRGEILYCVTWVFNADGKRRWWLVCAGAYRVVWIIDALNKKPVRNLLAHGEAIYDVQVHPRDPSLLITASKDESLRLWNLRTGAQIAIFAGLKGHHGEVVTVDWDRFGGRFASCSIDNSIRIWNFASDKLITDAILTSHEAADRGVDEHGYYVDEGGIRRKPNLVVCQEPAFVVRKIHKHYVDCVTWIGDALLTKSLHNMLYLWLPGADRDSLASTTQDYTLLQEYPVEGADVWFIRFGMSTRKHTIAVGGKNGIVTVMYLKEFAPKPIVLRPPGKKLPDDIYIRKCVFSDDAKIIIAVGDDAKVYQYDRLDVAKADSVKKKTSRSRKKRSKKGNNSNNTSEIAPMDVSGSASSTPRKDVGNTNRRRSNGVRSSPRNRTSTEERRASPSSATPVARPVNGTDGQGESSNTNGDAGSSSTAAPFATNGDNLIDDDDISTEVDSEGESERRARLGLEMPPVTAAAPDEPRLREIEMDIREMDISQAPSSSVPPSADEDEVQEVAITPSRNRATTPPRARTVSAIAPPPRPQPQPEEEDEPDKNDEEVVTVKEEMRTQRKDEGEEKETEIIEISD